MKLQLDKSGRIVLPKTLRQRLGLVACSTFEATDTAEGIILRPLQQRASLIERDGLLVHMGLCESPQHGCWFERSRLEEIVRMADSYMQKPGKRGPYKRPS